MSYRKYIDSKSQVAQISIAEDGVWYMLVTPYNPSFITEFKGAVSGKRRKWHPDKGGDSTKAAQLNDAWHKIKTGET